MIGAKFSAYKAIFCIFKHGFFAMPGYVWNFKRVPIPLVVKAAIAAPHSH